MLDRRAWCAGGAVLAALGVILGAGEALAQAAVPIPSQVEPTRQQLNPAREAPPSRRRTGDVFSAPAPETCVLPDDPKFRFKLQSVEVGGATRLSPEEIRSVWAEFDGRDITPATLCQIRDRLSYHLFKRGVLARVLIPQQEIAAGHVKFAVIEAQIVSVRFHGDIGPAQALVESYLNHLRGLAPFDLQTAQRYLLLANDIPGVHATAAISHSTAPGAPAGGLDLDVTLSRQPFDVVGAVQNTSSDTLGPWSGIARVDLDSFTRFGERTSLIGYTTLGNNSQEVVEIIEQARIGSQGLYAQGSFAYGISHPEGVLRQLHLAGDSYVGTVELDDPLVRLKQLNLTLGAGVDLIDQETDFPGGGILTKDKLRVAWVRADALADHDFAEPMLANYISTSGELVMEVRKGMDILGASRPGDADLSRIDGSAEGWVVRAEAKAKIHSEPVGGGGVPLTLSFHVDGEWADRPLLAYEQQAIGNLTIGRGYDPAAATGDRVVAGEVRLQAGPFAVGRWVHFGPYGFYDVAFVNNLELGSVNLTLRSVGGGVEFNLPYNIFVDVAYAKPLDKSFPSEANVPPARVLVQLVVRY